MFDTNFMTAFFDYLYEKCLNFNCPPNAYFCCADLLQKDDLWAECATAAVDYVHLAIRALVYVLVTYVFVGTLCYLCYNKRSDYAKKRILFVIALPKDESMLFGPTIMRLRNSCEIHLLCIMGGDVQVVSAKKMELWESCDALGIMSDHITFVKTCRRCNESLESKSRRTARIILDYIESMIVEEVYSYDYGFKKDTDHHSIFIGLFMMCMANEIPSYCQVYVLETVNAIRKYSSFADVALSMLTNKHIFVADKSDHSTIWRAMAKHKTQTSGYHMYYALHSRYMYVNTYILVERDDIQWDLHE